MRTTIFAAAGFALAAATPAFAQAVSAEAEARLAPPPPVSVEADTGIDAVLGTGALPGVGMSTTTTTERGGPSGAGGLSGGVGAAGVPAPGLMSGAPGTTGPLNGIPLDTTPGVPTAVSPN